MIYLDHNASTPVDPEVSDAIFSSLKRDFGNASSIHLPGRRAKDVLEASRKTIADLLECSPKEIFFTSGGTESNNLVLLGTGMCHQSGHIIISAIEHPSVFKPAQHLASKGFDVTYIPAERTGSINPETISNSVRKNTILISVMHANNETGVIQPIADIASLAKKHAIPFHVDAAQSIGKVFFTLNNLSVDMLTLVPHKFYGPKGIAALYIRSGCKLSPLMFGGEHEMGLRPGTENVPGVAGFAKACQITMRDLSLRIAHTSQLRTILLENLLSGIPDIVLNGQKAERLPNTLNVCIPGVYSDDVVNKVSDEVAISSGSACHSGKRAPSRVLKSMGLSDQEALSSIRLSVGKDNTEDEVQEAAKIIIAAVNELREDARVKKSSTRGS